MKILFYTIGIFIVTINTLVSQTTYTWNGSTAAWNTPTNWTPNGIPGSSSTDIVVIDATTITPVLDANRTIQRLTVTNGQLNLGANTLQVLNTTNISSSHVINGTLRTYGGTDILGSHLSADLYVLSTNTGLFSMSNSSVTGVVDITIPGWSDNFESNTISGSYLKISKVAFGNAGYPGDNTIINCPTTVTAISADVRWGRNPSKHVFNGDLTILSLGTNPTVQFVTVGGNEVLIRGNLIVKDFGTYAPGFDSDHIGIFRFGNYTITGDIYWANRMVTNTVNNNKSIAIGYNTGLNNMLLRIGGGIKMSSEGCSVSGTHTGDTRVFEMSAFLQSSTGVSNVMSCPGSATIHPRIELWEGTLAGQNLIRVDRMDYSSMVYGANTHIHKTGPGSEYASGNNTFLGAAIIENTGSGELLLCFQAWPSPRNEEYRGDVYFYSNPGRIGINRNQGYTIFKGDVYFGCTTAGGDICFTWNNNPFYTTILGAVKLAPSGFNNGTLRIHNVRQLSTVTSQVLSMTGSSVLILGDNHNTSSNVWNGPITFIGPDIQLNGNVFNNTVYMEKNSNNTALPGSRGGNTFNSTTTLVMSSPLGGGWNIGGGNGSGDLSGDTFNGPLVLINSGIGSDLSLSSGPNQNLVSNNTITAININNSNSNGRIGINANESGDNSGGIAYLNNNLLIRNSRVTTNSWIFVGSTHANNRTHMNSPSNIILQTFTGGSIRLFSVSKYATLPTLFTYTNLTTNDMNVEIRNSTMSGDFLIQNANTVTRDNVILNGNIYNHNVSVIGFTSLNSTNNLVQGQFLASVSGWKGVSFNTNTFVGLANISSNYVIPAEGSTHIQLIGNVFNNAAFIYANGNWDQRINGRQNLFQMVSTLIGSTVGDLEACTFVGSTSIINRTGGSTGIMNSNIFRGSTTLTQNGNHNNWQFSSGISSYNSLPNIFEGNVTFNGTGSAIPRMSDNVLEVYKGNVTTNRELNWAVGNSTHGITSFTGSGIQTIAGTVPQHIRNVTIDKSGGRWHLGYNLSVSGALQLVNGIADLSGKSLHMTSNTPANLVRTNGYVYAETPDWSSRFIWNIGSGTGAFVYPFGNQDGTYIPFTLQANSGTLGVAWVSSYRPSGAGLTPYPWPATNLNRNGSDNSAQVARRFWHISATGTSFLAGAVFRFDVSNEAAAAAPAIYNAQRWNPAALPTPDWDPFPSGQSYSAGQVTVTTVPSFSSWAVVGSVFPLPLGFIWFDAQQIEKSHMLQWIVKHEEGTSHFEVEYSADGIQYYSLGSVAYTSDSKVENSFSYTNRNAQQARSVSYYRIKKVMKNGEFVYSEIKVIEPKTSQNHSTIQIYPNPVAREKTITLFSESIPLDGYNFTISDTQGRPVLSGWIENGNSISLPENIVSGTYFLHVQGEKTKTKLKLLVF